MPTTRPERSIARQEHLESRRLLSATIGANFNGTTRSESGFFPPDTMGAVGPNHFVELINGRYKVYNKSGTVLLSRSLDQFFIDRGIVPSGFAFDPRVEFDPVAQKWYAAAVDASSSAASSFLFAVSTTTNPLDGWTAFRVDADPSDGRWADFPQMGYDNTGVYLTANMFDNPGGSALSTTVNVVVLPKEDLLLTTPTIARRTLLQGVSSTTGFSVAPIIAPSGAPQQGVLVSGGTSSLNFSQVSGSIFTPTISALSDPSIPSRGAAPLGRQPDGSQTLQSGNDARVRTSVYYQLGSYWIVQTIASPTFASSAVRMLRIDGASRTLQQEAILQQSDLDFLYPSIGVNSRGDVVVGCSASGPTTFAGAYAFVGTTTGNTTTFGSPIVLQAGAANYSVLDGSSRNRWGDYSATTVDPSDPTRIWTIQEFVASTNQYRMKISELRFAPVAPSDPDLALASDSGTSQTDNLTNDSTPTFTGTGSPGALVTIRSDGADVGTATVDASGNYSVTASVLSDGPHAITAVQSVGGLFGPVSSPLAIIIDTLAPSLLPASAFEFLTTQALALVFSETIIAPAAADVVIRNLTTNQFVPDSQKVITASGASLRVEFASILANGAYELTVASPALADAAGNSVAIVFTDGPTDPQDFLVLAGDLNRNRVVDFDDLLTLAQNYGQTGQNFAQGNITYDAGGLVDFDDLLALSQNYGSAVLTGSAPTARRSRVAELSI